MKGKSKSRSSRRKEAHSEDGRGSQSLVTSAATIKEDAPPYRTGQDEQDSQDQPATTNPVPPVNPVGKLRFIDLFCGIGGFRLAFERAGCQCVFSSDWNEMAQITYEANFGERPHGDIYSVPDNAIPPHHILCAGFPCQPFSIAGVSKKLSLGKAHGFEDKEQGNLFFKLAELIDHHRPDAFVLENVKHLTRHDQGNTFRIIWETLTDHLKYHVHHRVIDAQSVVPQHRERIFLVGFRERRHFEFPEFPREGPKLETILDPEIPDKHTLTDQLWNCRIAACSTVGAISLQNQRKKISRLRQERHLPRMANTYTQIYIHIVFAVEGRQSLIAPEPNEELQKYITGIVSGQKHKLIVINNMPDHLHLLVGLRPDAALSELVRDSKANSSRFINEKRWVLGRFSWQEGFGAFSYSRSKLGTVIRYIERQQEHHAKKSFRHEYTALLEHFGVQYDQRYIFKRLDD